MSRHLKLWIITIVCCMSVFSPTSGLAKNTGQLAAAQISLKQAEIKYGATSLKIIRYLNRLAKLYWKQGNKDRAITLYKRALALQEKQLGYSHPDTLLTLRRLAFLTQKNNSPQTQQKIKDKLIAIRQKRIPDERKFSQLQGKKQSLAQKYKRINARSRASQAKVKRLRQQQSSHKRAKANALKKQANLKSRLAGLQKQERSLKAGLARQKRKQSALQRQVSALSQKKRSARTALGQAQQQQRNHQAALRTNLSQINRQNRIVSGGSRKVRGWQQQQASARRKLRAVSPRLARLAAQKRRLIAQLRKADKKNRPALNRKLASLRQSENRLRNSSTALKRQISNLGQRIARFRRSQSSARSKLAQLRKTTPGLKRKTSQGAGIIKSAKAILQAADKRLRSQLPRLKTVKKNTARLQTKVAALRQKTQQAQKQYNKAQNKSRQASSRMTSVSREIRQSQANATKMQQQAAQLQSKRQSLRRSEKKYKTALRQSRRKENNLSASLRTVRKMLAPAQNIAETNRNPAKPLTVSSEQVVRVYYGTDRNDLGEDKKTERYGVKRSAFSYGYSDVSIPPNHVPGALEDYSWLKFEFSPNPKKHVVLTKITRLAKEDFFASLTTKVDSTESRDAFIFVHGYYNSFKDAARRTAQMAFDMGFEGAPIFYSWPSQGKVTGYPVDSANVEWGQGHLQDFIVDIIRKTKATRLHLIGHSMGSRALAKSLINIRQLLNDEEQDVLKEIILAAPDIDASLFLDSIAPKIRHENSRITVYTSQKDKALDMSKRYNGFARLGNLLELTRLPEGVDIIDASAVITSFVGHSYFGSNQSIISDMRSILGSSTPLEKRCYLKPTTTQIGKYWLFLLGKCEVK